MSKYTVELRRVIDLYGREEVKSWFTKWEFSDYLSADEIAVINARGTFSKDKLAEMILDAYYMREIGFETPDYFRHRVIGAMREIMEEKAPLIYSAAIKYDPLVNVDFTETFDRTNTNSGGADSTSTSNGTGLTINSDTPQGQINKTNILAGNYATTAQGNESETTVTDKSTSKAEGTDHFTRTTKGNSGVSATAQRMVQQYRENIILINRDIVESLRSLFMGVF